MTEKAKETRQLYRDVYEATFNRLISASIKQGDFRPLPLRDTQTVQGPPVMTGVDPRHGVALTPGESSLRHARTSTIGVGPYTRKSSPQHQESQLEAIGAAAHRSAVAAVKSFQPWNLRIHPDHPHAVLHQWRQTKARAKPAK